MMEITLSRTKPPLSDLINKMGTMLRAKYPRLHDGQELKDGSYHYTVTLTSLQQDHNKITATYNYKRKRFYGTSQ